MRTDAILAHFAAMEKLRLQVRMVGGDWDALVLTTQRNPRTIEGCWSPISEYIIGGGGIPYSGSEAERIVADYVTFHHLLLATGL